MATSKGLTKFEGVSLYGLTDKQKRFVVEYWKDFNATAAAKRAGYKHAQIAGQKLINPKIHPKMTRVIGQLQRKHAKQATMTKEDVVTFLSNVIDVDPVNLVGDGGEIIVNDLKRIPEEVRKLIDDVKAVVKTDEHGFQQTEFHVTMMKKSKAIELLMKHLGMFAAEKHDVRHEVSIAALVQRTMEGEDNLDVIEGKIAALEKE